MHIALYRKYRPRTFSEVMGQKYVVDALKNQIASGKIGHAFIFSGTRGTGKTSCAKVFAKAVNCLNPVNGEPCLECDVCKGIENETIYDVTEMDAASNNSVNDIRDIINEVSYLPVMAKYRVFIIDEAHMLSQEAFNALLKTLEEPPAHVIFILATTEIHRIPATILSRCQRYDFNRLSVEDIAENLLQIAKEENIDLTAPAAGMIASLGDGAMRDAISILDTCIAAGNHVDETVVANVTGTPADDDIFALVDSLIKDDMPRAMAGIRQLSARNVEMKIMCERVISHLSNLLIAGLNNSSAELIRVSQPKFEKLKEQAATCNRRFISKALDSFINAQESISKGRSPQVAMDIAVYTVLNDDLRQTMPVTRQVQSGPAKTVQTQRQPRTVQSRPMSVDADKVQENTGAEEKVLPQEFEYWQKVVDVIADVDIPLHSFIKSSQAYLYEGVVYIKGNEGLNNYIRTNREVNGIIKKAILQVCGRTYNIGGYRNIANLFEEKQQDSFNDILSLRDKGVQVDIKD